MRQYSLGDYVVTFIGFIGLAVPNFLLALVLYLGFAYFNANIGGLFSAEFVDAPWSLAKVWDLLKHLPIPALILGLAGTAQLIRIMRANLLDELRKPYVMTARAKGLPERAVILKYPVRVALNPFASTIGYTAAVRRLGQHHRLAGPEPADRRPAAPEGADRPGHVPGRHDRAAARRHDGDRHASLRPAPAVDRPAHPVKEADKRPAQSGCRPVTAPLSRARRGRVAADLAVGEVAEERISVASQWQLMWWRFRKHKLAMAARSSSRSSTSA